MVKAIFWNRRSGDDRRHDQSDQLQGDDRRVGDRRMYRSNDYLLVIGGYTGLDRFTVLVFIPALVIIVAAFFASVVTL